MKKFSLFLIIAIIAIGETETNTGWCQAPTDPAQGFNLFVKNGASFNSGDMEGAAAMGGDLSIISGYQVSAHNNFYYQYNKLNVGLLVGGKVNYNGGSSFQVLNNGYVLIGNQNGSKAWYKDPNNAYSPIRITPGTDYNGSPRIELSANAQNLGNVSETVNPIFVKSPIDFNAAFTTLQASATSISGLTDNTIIYNTPNQGASPLAKNAVPSNSQIYLTALKTGVNVLNISGSNLNNFTSLTFNGQKPDATHVLVVNINAPGSFTWNAFTPGGIGGQNAAYIFYNFYNTTNLSIAGYGVVEGTVFAPSADITKNSNNSNIEGQVIGLSYNQSAGGEIHSYNFTSTIVPGISAPTTAASAINFDNVDLNTISSLWTNGNGTGRIVVVSKTPITTLPTNGTTYTANPAFGIGTALAGGYVVYNGTGSNLIVSNLTANTTYYFAVIEYNGTGANIVYGPSYASNSTKTLADTDGDGVADIYDNYPNDVQRAFNNYYPVSGFGTYLFEDNWPAMGDYDFNDLTVNYQYNTVTDARNNVVELKAKFVTRSIGASFKNGFALQLDNLSPALVSAVSGNKVNATSWLAFDANGTESNQTYANIIVTDNANRLLPSKSADGFSNTVAGATFITPDTTNLTISFQSGKVVTKDIAINPYLIINQTRSRELHLANRLPTGKADPNFFGSSQDKTVPSKGVYYVNANNIPWALDVPANIPHPYENIDITKAYLNLAPWALSGGVSFTDWYTDKAGNRNASNLYSK